MDNSNKYTELRQRYPLFEYMAYHSEVCPEGLRLRFDFRMGNVAFHPTALIEHRPFLQATHTDIDRLVFEIGMAELVSYWKCACPPRVRVGCGSLTEEDVHYWKKLYFNGLGEFFYTNGISATEEDFMLIESTEASPGEPPSAATPPLPHPESTTKAYLVPIGGGKDSVVTLELLRTAGYTCRPLIMNPRGATIECARAGGYSMEEVLVVRRTIDPTLLSLNAQGFLNGHTPFSAMLATYTMLCSAMSGVAAVALSNESSANESTVLGTTVNHQYSKSLEFEDDFRAHCASLPLKQPWGFRYFSFLRPLSELQIALLFSRLEKFHDVFRSCNVGSKQDVWCGHCAKCLFAFIILSPFVKPARLTQIFGRNLLDDRSLQTEFDQLVGHSATKPFECVGTVSEVHQALALAQRRWYADGRPALLRDWQTEAADFQSASLAAPHLAPSNLNDDELKIICSTLHDAQTELSSPFYRSSELRTLLQGQRLLIAGYGREGRSVEALIAKLLPSEHPTIAHEVKAGQWRDSAGEWHSDWDYTLIIKSPGIPMAALPQAAWPRVSSLTDLFMQVYADRVVGVTGTKGKSTTASLLHHLLPGSLLAGNIGVPLFDVVEQMDDSKLVVAELSCHQLEVLHRGPHIGLILNLFEEHLDHYSNYRAYQMAKLQMGLRQSEADHLYYCTDNAALCSLVEELHLPSRLHPYTIASTTTEEQLALSRLPLQGEHNRSNALVAIRIAAQLTGATLEELGERLASFKGLRHRLELVSQQGGRQWYDDSISTIPAATIAALRSLPRVDALILGGMDRGIDYQPLADYLRAHTVRNVAFVGEAGRRILSLMKEVDFNYIVDDDYEHIVRWCATQTAIGDTVLLSPAAASYDQFRNFEHRGDTYAALISSL